MSEYSKKLHIKYNGVQTDIKLYTTTNEVGNNYIGLYDGITNIYAKLDTTSGTNLHIRKNGTIYNVIKEIEYACPTGSYYNINIFDALHLWNTNFEGTDTFVCPAGVKIVRTVADSGYCYASITAGKSYVIKTVTNLPLAAEVNRLSDIYINGKNVSQYMLVNYGMVHSPDAVAWSAEINTHTPNYSWD